jgi:hypothetical protein
MNDAPSVSNIIDAIGVTTLQRAFGHVNASTVSSWKQRHSIPHARWPKLIEVAKARGVTGITADTLMRACAARERNREAAE